MKKINLKAYNVRPSKNCNLWFWNKQARKLQATLVRVRNYYRLTYSLTGVKCRATSVAKKSFDTSKFFLIFTFKFMLETNQTTVHILFSKFVCSSCPFFSTSTVSVFPEGSSHVSVFSYTSWVASKKSASLVKPEWTKQSKDKLRMNMLTSEKEETKEREN